MSVEEARQEGRSLANEKRQDTTLVPTDNARAEAVPGYGGTALPQGAYFDDPERMEAEAAATKASNEQYRITTDADRSEEHTSELQSLMRISYAVFCLKKKKNKLLLQAKKR